MTKFLLGGAVVAVLATFAPAAAQSGQTGPTAQTPMHHSLGSQVHSRAQLGARVQSMFARLDTDRDGFISRAESDVAEGKGGERQTMRAQRRGNRSTEQRAANRATVFDRLDANRDGVLSRDEFARAQHGGQRVAGADRPNRRSRRPDAGGTHSNRAMGISGLRGRMFDMADIDRDARVSLQEATAAAYRHFDMADANRDGQVSREERMQVRQRLRAERRPG